jgi:hypothetical protein
MIVPPFTFFHNDTAYKISFDRKENDHTFLNAESVLTGEVQNFMINNCDKGSGNEHLLEQLEGKAAHEYVRRLIDMFTFSEMGYFPDVIA